jgi:DNA-binding response OmpR family regulator
MEEKKRILVVDDEATLRESLTGQLKAEGYVVSSAEDGDIAIEMLGSTYFDLILLDLKMPHVDGFEVLRFVKEKHPAIKVLVLTGFSDLKNAIDTKGLGADSFIGKPFDRTELLSTIQRLLGSS